MTPFAVSSASSGQAHDAEMQLLCACVRPVQSPVPARFAPATRPVCWERFLMLATNHHVLPLVYKSLKAAGRGDGASWITALLPPGGAPGDVMDTLKRRYLSIVAHNVRITATLSGLQRLLKTHGIDVAPIKGPALAILAHGNVGMRQFEDLDLLVRPRDLMRTVHVLEEAGYAVRGLPVHANRGRYAASLQDWSMHKEIGRVQLDLKPVLIWQTLSTPQSTEFMLESRELLSTGNGNDLLAPGPEAMLLAVCVDGTCDMWGKLAAVVDVAALMVNSPGADWRALLEVAARLGHERSLLVGACVAEALLGGPLPPDIRDAAEADAVARRLAAEAVASLRDAPGNEASVSRRCLFAFRTRKGMRDRCRYVSRLLFVPNATELRLVALPKGLYFAYALFRPLRLAWDVAGFRRRRHRPVTSAA